MATQNLIYSQKEVVKMNEFSVKDLGEAAVLLMAGMTLLNFENIDGICWFTFSEGDKCQSISNDYWFSEYLVDAKTYRETMNHLKNKIFSVKN